MNEAMKGKKWWLSGGKEFSLFVGVVLVIVAAYWETVEALIMEWETSLYSHAWLTVCFTFYAIWKEKGAIPKDPKFRWVGALLILGSGVLWWLSVIVSVALFQHLSLLGLIVGLLWLVWGWRALPALKYILIVFALALPLWKVLQHPLRFVSAEVSAFVVKLYGIPVLYKDYTLSVPGGNFHVELACAGLAFILAGSSLVFIFAALQRLKISHAMVLWLISTAVAILANWIRIVAIIVVGNATNMQSEIVQDHLTFGWVVFGVIYFPVFYLLVSRVSWASAGVDTVQGAGEWKKGFSFSFVAGFAVLLIFPIAHQMIMSGFQNKPSASAIARVDALPSLSLGEPIGIRWAPQFSGAQYENTRKVNSRGRVAALYLAEYPVQTQDAELINVNNAPFDKSIWGVEKEFETDHSSALLLARGSQQRLICYRYLVAGKPVVTEREAKLQQLLGYFAGKPEAYVVAVMRDMSYRDEVDKVVEYVDQLLNDVVPAIVARAEE